MLGSVRRIGHSLKVCLSCCRGSLNCDLLSAGWTVVMVLEPRLNACSIECVIARKKHTLLALLALLKADVAVTVLVLWLHGETVNLLFRQSL